MDRNLLASYDNMNFSLSKLKGLGKYANIRGAIMREGEYLRERYDKQGMESSQGY